MHSKRSSRVSMGMAVIACLAAVRYGSSHAQHTESPMAEEPQHPRATERQTAGFHPGFSIEAELRAERELVEKVPADSCLEIRQRCLNSSPDLPVTEIPAGALQVPRLLPSHFPALTHGQRGKTKGPSPEQPLNLHGIGPPVSFYARKQHKAKGCSTTHKNIQLLNQVQHSEAASARVYVNIFAP